MYRHTAYATLKKLLQMRVNVYLVGPAGSGKSLLVEQIAKDDGIDFYCQSVGAQTTVTNLMGYMDANGRYVASTMRRAYENGGVFLIDEIDAGSANVFTCINSALSNTFCSFPDGMVAKHPHFVCVAAANTYGTGRDYRYVGRNHLDAATLDRFAFVNVDYDISLERSLVKNDSWYARITAIRQAAQESGIDLIVSMRTAITGASLLADKFPQKLVEQMLVWKGLDPESMQKVKKKADEKEKDANDQVKHTPEKEDHPDDHEEEEQDDGKEIEEFAKNHKHKEKEKEKGNAVDPTKGEGGTPYDMVKTKTKLSLGLDDFYDR